MQQEGTTPTQPPPQKPAVDHVTEAHRLLQTLRKRAIEHPELDQAIKELEMALSILAVKTGGML